jgi:nucleotide-binding universal stress UspA family protein
MKVLVAVDGSPSSLDAVSLVGRLVNPTTDEVAIFFSPLEVEKKLAGRSETLVEGAAAAVIEEAAKRLPPTMAKKAEPITSSKPPAVGILTAAETWKADLIIVGARGMSSVERLLLGSVSRAVLHGAHLPVLVVRAAPAENAMSVLACHHEASAAAVAAIVGKLHWPAVTKGRVIAVAESLLAGPLPTWLENRVRDPDTAAIAKAWEQEHAEEVSRLTQRLDAFQKSLPPAFHGSKPIVLEGNPGDRIIATAKSDHDDLIVLGRTPTDALTRWLLGSTSEAVLMHAHTNVLLVPVHR